MKRIFALLVAPMILSPIQAVGSSAGLSEADLINAIEGRQEKVRDIQLKYSLKIEHTDDYYSIEKQRAKVMTKLVKQGLIKARPLITRDIVAPIRRQAYEYFRRGDEVGYRLYSSPGRELEQRGSYDGELFRCVLFPDLQATVSRRTLKEVIAFPLPGDMLTTSGVDWHMLLASDSFHVSKITTSRQEGEVLVRVRATRTLPESEERPASSDPDKGKHIQPSPKTVLVFDVQFNASKDYWPELFQAGVKYGGADDNDENSDVIPHRECRIVGWHKVASGAWYPAQIVKTSFASPSAGSSPVATEIRTMTIETVEINSGISDSDIETVFPEGTSYLDERDGRTYLVGADGSVTDRIAQMKGPFLPVSEYTKKEAAKLMGPPTGTATVAVGAANNHGLSWLMIANIAVIAVILAFLAYRRYRPSTS